MSINLDTNGILSNKTDMSGNKCQVLGNLQCDNEEMPACSGMGIIDCTDDCPGTEEEFKHFKEVMDDPDFANKYPKITEMAKKRRKKDGEEHKTKTKSIKKMFLESLTKCKTFSKETLLEIQLAQGGMKIGSDLTHPLKLKTVTDVQMIPAPTCIVKNMTCSEFPLKSKCRGIGIGRCGSNVDMLKQRLTPVAAVVLAVHPGPLLVHPGPLLVHPGPLLVHPGQLLVHPEMTFFTKSLKIHEKINFLKFFFQDLHYFTKIEFWTLKPNF